MTRGGCAELGPNTFAALGIMRIYTEEPGKDPDRERPFALSQGSTVGDLARTIHNEIAAKPWFARVWGQGAFAGGAVGEAHILSGRGRG